MVVGAAVVVVVVVPPVHAWSAPHDESFWQVWHNWPVLPQVVLFVPIVQAPVAVQHPLKSVSPQVVQTEPAVPQTNFPSKAGLALLTAAPEPFGTQTSSAPAAAPGMQQPFAQVDESQMQTSAPLRSPHLVPTGQVRHTP